MEIEEKQKEIKDVKFYNEQLDYSHIDPQKGNNSPRELFKDHIKGRIFNSSINNKDKNLFNLISSNQEIDKYNLYENFVENYLDLVNEMYFSSSKNEQVFQLNQNTNLDELSINQESDITDIKEKDKEKKLKKTKKDKKDNSNQQKLNNFNGSVYSNNENKFKFTSLDFLLNPLRSQLPFEKWNPFEIALFQSCICKYGRDFELISYIIKTKSIEDIQEFYYSWEKTKYFEAWAQTQVKKGKNSTKLI